MGGKDSEKGGRREKGGKGEKGGHSGAELGGGDWSGKGPSRRGKGGGSGKGKGRGKKGGGDGCNTAQVERPQQGKGGLQLQSRLQDPPPPPQHWPGGSAAPQVPSSPSAAAAGQEGDAAHLRAKDEVFAEIRKVLDDNSRMQLADFDFRVRQHLHALYGSGGKERLREALAMLQSSTLTKDRPSIKKWPAYLLTLLKRFDADFASQDREARARARVEAAAMAAGDPIALGGAVPKALQLLHTPTPASADPGDPLSLDSPTGGPWASWGMPVPQSPVAAR